MTSHRLAFLDLARGIAVLAMAVYHFSWDLSWFALVDWPVAQGAGWRAFAASIAGSFLLLAGISLDLAHHEGIRWQSFWRREAVIIAAAASVSTVTYFVFADSFVRFGILHCIAAASLLALPAVRAPLWAAILAATFFFSLPTWASSTVFDGQAWLWTGLGTPDFGSVDYVPLTPWVGLTLAGVALSKLARQTAFNSTLSAFRFDGSSGRSLRLAGRHSLSIYLVHQPVLYGLVWAFASLGVHGDRAERSFVRNCTTACQETLGSSGICTAACSCTLEQMTADNTWQELMNAPADPALR
ncbi:DUF1624 domain-containing protein [Roseibium denhamense]|uniref:Uncharacterized membrane protein n=2 Tax=Roseibium denhamense TaxID=76305 RepID=A0ABY1NE93_9HYPH|nr:DUF1624 domain-containing protein [Roseibium denhamense]SMP07584.1 Uncharacterized membrane protein [Roseibium denhamense]